MDRARAAHGQQLLPTSCPDMGTGREYVRGEDLKKRGEGLWRRREWHWVSTLRLKQDWRQQTGYLGGA